MYTGLSAVEQGYWGPHLLWYSEVLPSQHSDLLIEITCQDAGCRHKKGVKHDFQVQLVSILEECFD